MGENHPALRPLPYLGGGREGGREGEMARQIDWSSSVSGL